ncbi:MAG: TIGR02300 family protein [Proteobacteria bacterium]|nr:TIGR02300 family protein [Pseudomonadota bacterium]
MAKPEWGTKRTCPECSTRFYDLGKDEPATCISCGRAWTPEPLLPSRPTRRGASRPFHRRPPWTPK